MPDAAEVTPIVLFDIFTNGLFTEDRTVYTGADILAARVADTLASNVPPVAG